MPDIAQFVRSRVLFTQRVSRLAPSSPAGCGIGVVHRSGISQSGERPVRHTALMASPFLYFANDRLSMAELSAARLDGDVVELGEAYIPADAVETRGLRAGSLAGILGDTLAATHLSAAWIHGALPDPPARHTVQRAVHHRLHWTPDRRLVYRDLAVDPADLIRVGGVHVTNATRTLADLSRVDDGAHLRAAQLLAGTDPELAGLAIAWLDEHRQLPHRNGGIAVLRRCAEPELPKTELAEPELAEPDCARPELPGRQEDVTR